MQTLNAKNSRVKEFNTEDIFNLFFNNSIVGHSIIYPDGKFHVNEAFSYMLGYEVEELNNLDWKIITHKDDLEKSLIMSRNLFNENKKEGIIKKRYIKKDKTPIEVLIHVTLVDVENIGKSLLTTIVNTDRDERNIKLTNLINETTNYYDNQKKANEESSKYRSISKCLSIVFDDKDEQINFALNTAMKITNSKLGLILIFNKRQNSFSLKKLSNGYKDFTDITKLYENISIKSTGLWNKVVEKKEPIIINTQKDVFRSNILPNNHMEINRVIIIPILRESNIVATVCVANKEKEYTKEEMQAASILMTGIWNIVELKNSAEEQKYLLEQRNSMFNNHEAIMLIINPENGNILNCNPAANKFYGYSEKELRNMNIDDINQLEKEEIHSLMKEVAKKKQKYFTFPHKLKNGEIRLVDVYSSPIKYNDIDALYSIIFDVTEREKANYEIKYLSRHDHLTSIYNRRTFEGYFSDYNTKANYPLAVIVGDVNSLKVYNDTFGHSFGDELLKKSASLLRKVFPDCIVARIGGDEFGVLVKKADETEIRERINLLNKLCDQTNILNSTESLLSIAMGYSIQKDENATYEDLMKEAESYVYANKYFDNRSIKNNTVNLIMDTLFEKSAREKNHSNRVGEIAALIAERMNMSNNEINKIKAAGLLHDIGKIGINESILNKPGKLTDDEWLIMKSHVERSHRILSNSIEFSNIAEIVRNHHERVDGHGYPRGLKGDKIPLESKILILADSFDAMTNYRPYKNRMSFEEAKNEIIKCKNSQFDAEVVEVFIQMMDEGLIN
ncbi:HD domain-containing phosphohydrolase [Candidatus Izemoplasma sp. B36]|uniref:sensor domain-containing diguanylate cyclase/phosphohydrolase n=1 Tax=Candidatus Izemoplasma sp. B36 TaxID=3242468 RepID=UPI003557B618